MTQFPSHEELASMPDAVLAELYAIHAKFLKEISRTVARSEQFMKSISKIVDERMATTGREVEEYPSARILRTVKNQYTVSKENAPLFRSWLWEKYASTDPDSIFSYFTQSISTTALKEYVAEHGTVPPGVTVTPVGKLTITPRK